MILLTTGELARELDVSRSTVERWMKGETAPVKAMLPLILTTIKKAQLKKVAKWGDEDCTEHAIEARKSMRRGLEAIGRPPIYPRRECHTCWQALLKEIE